MGIIKIYTYSSFGCISLWKTCKTTAAHYVDINLKNNCSLNCLLQPWRGWFWPNPWEARFPHGSPASSDGTSAGSSHSILHGKVRCWVLPLHEPNCSCFNPGIQKLPMIQAVLWSKQLTNLLKAGQVWQNLGIWQLCKWSRVNREFQWLMLHYRFGWSCLWAGGSQATQTWVQGPFRGGSASLWDDGPTQRQWKPKVLKNSHQLCEKQL